MLVKALHSSGCHLQLVILHRHVLSPHVTVPCHSVPNIINAQPVSANRISGQPALKCSSNMSLICLGKAVGMSELVFKSIADAFDKRVKKIHLWFENIKM